MARAAKEKLWLVVEDDDNDFLLFCRACSRALSPPPCIHREKDGAAAQTFLCEYTGAPCLIVSDLNMPKMTGLELLAWIRKREELRRVPFFLLTSSVVAHDIRTA